MANINSVLKPGGICLESLHLHRKARCFERCTSFWWSFSLCLCWSLMSAPYRADIRLHRRHTGKLHQKLANLSNCGMVSQWNIWFVILSALCSETKLYCYIYIIDAVVIWLLAHHTNLLWLAKISTMWGLIQLDLVTLATATMQLWSNKWNLSVRCTDASKIIWLVKSVQHFACMSKNGVANLKKV